MPRNPTTSARAEGPERAVALSACAAPPAVGMLAPLLDGSAATLGPLAYAIGGTFLAANYMRRIPPEILNRLPAGDLLRAHRSTLFISTLTSGMALGSGMAMGPQGADALMAGWLALPSVPGIVSLGWWAAVALVPIKLRNVLGRRRPTTQSAPVNTPPLPPTEPEAIMKLWGRYISDPRNGTHKHQVLSDVVVRPRVWTGVITAPAGAAVTVTEAAVSSVFRIPAPQVKITDGYHAGDRRITVHRQAPAELDPSTLAGAWRKWVASSVMPGSHLVDVQQDPFTGGEVAYVVADEDTPRLIIPSQSDLAGALRTTTLLCSYTPVPGNPRRGVIRTMKDNPLEQGVPFPGRDVLVASEGGYVQIGRHVSGRPARLQFKDPKLGARHIFIAGVTGSGKGGIVQLVALADHVNGHGIIYSDPKGSSNPDVETMSAYSGLGEAGCIGGMRVAYALMKWRIQQSARLGMKNFIATPDRPWMRYILDEAHVPLAELEEHKKEAKIMLEALAAKARSLGMPLCIVNQAVNADKLGGSTTLRTNVIQGGSLVMLRTDTDQRNLTTTGFEGVDPGAIPATWDLSEQPLVFDESTVLADPVSTYSLGYTLGPGGTAEMMRGFILESAGPHIHHDEIVLPHDWPDWQYREEIAATSIPH
ncbi:hypothetical protein ACIG3E_33025 [Streptomyces sp. NPDC053474]|uniref:hypothetical protein n=1 Tax=Streptomyces sp. NPDC053474 TaxID=3365704 RepID=UPI0037CDD8F6